MKRLRPFLNGVLVSLLLSGLVGAHRYGWFFSTGLETLELQSLDVLFRLRGPRPTGDQVVLLAYDDRTLDERPRLFERRAGVAEVIAAATAQGVAVLGLDLMFSEPEVLLNEGLQADLTAWAQGDEGPDSAERALLLRVLREIRGDAELLDAIKASRNAILAMHVGAQGSLDAADRSLAKGKYGQVVPGPWLPEEEGRVLASEARFNKAARGLGLITTYQDITGTVREIPLAIGLQGSVFMPLAVHLVAQREGISRAQLGWLGTEGVVRLGERSLQAERDRMMMLNYRGADAFPTWSVLDLVEGRIPPVALEGKIAIVGYTHLGSDAVQTPFGRRPGMEVHATAVDNILRGDPLHRAPPWLDAVLVLVTGLLASAAFGVRRVGPLGQLLTASLVVVAAVGGAAALFATHDLWLVIASPLLVGALATLAGLATAYFQEGIQRRTLRRSFAHYLSDELVAELVSDPSRVSLRGERRELTVLFSDIRSFTTFSERTEPEVLASFLNAYFTPMTQAVLNNAGYIDKFIGDAVMALFGAPVARPEHASHACRCALDMYTGLDQVRPIAEKIGIELNIGVGINTGEMVVGNMGSETRFDYTVLGDAVNLASRIEGLTKQYGVFCLVGEATAREARGFTFRTIDLVRVKGKEDPVELFELCGGPERVINPLVGLERWDAAQGAYRRGAFTEARGGFEAFAIDNPDDPAVRLFLDRLGALDAAPAGWDGVFTHTKK
ncbi:MAG: adenylate/guanylate cyclase domain-containing protein [Deltaproteobacteria bacterium]|nr:adenylate/guanylate cyclase domain-containing protein [Deltaproteobacteria bacterium]